MIESLDPQPTQQHVARALPLIRPTAILPHPTLTEVAIGEVGMPGGASAIVLQFVTATGAQLYFIEKEVAKQLAAQLNEIAGAGIVVVPAGTSPIVKP